MINLTEGYYWLKNISCENKVIFRPIRVFVKTEAGYFGSQWYSKGSYVEMFGSDDVFNLSYLETWAGVEFIKLEEPKSEV